jgi:peroxiredoxin
MKPFLLFLFVFVGTFQCLSAQEYPFVSKEYRMLQQEDFDSSSLIIKPGILLFNERGDTLPMSQLSLMTNNAYRPRFFVNATNDIKAIVFENKNENPILVEKSLNDSEFIINTKAPDFIAFDMDGNSIKLSELQGKVVVLNFWFIKCGPCVQEMPELNALKKQFNTKDVVFLAITFDKKENVQTFLETKPFAYTIAPNASDVVQLNRVRSFPTNVVLDKNGMVVFQETGYRTNIKESLSTIITKFLE